jgi:acetyltransferase EpsM
MSLYILGAGDAAAEIRQLAIECGEKEEIFYAISEEYFNVAAKRHHVKCIRTISSIKTPTTDIFVVGAGVPEAKYFLVNRAAQFIFDPVWAQYIHPTVFASDMKTREGVTMLAGSLLANFIHIGRHAHISLGCTIGHDVYIGDYCAICPGVHISGRVHIHEGVFVGTGANIVPGIKVGEWSRIGAGCTVVEDVPPNSTVVGVPGRVVSIREKGWHEPK